MRRAVATNLLFANAHPRVPCEGDCARAGMTLVELLMVMSLVALVLGFGIGALTSIDVGSRSAVGLVQSSLRSARNWSVARDAPARVSVDLAQGTLSAEGISVIGTWHFEQRPLKGAFELNGTLDGAELVDDGFLGRALSFVDAATGSAYEVAVHKDPAYNFENGFVIECVLRPESTEGGRVLALGKAVSVSMESQNGIKVEFAAMRESATGERKSVGKAILHTPPGVLPLGEWSRVMISYDRNRLRVFVEGVLVGELPETAFVGPLEASMLVGGGRRGWQGAIDSLVVSAVAVSERVQLPDGASFGPATPAEVVFWPGGGLDRTVHREPVIVTIQFDDDVVVPIRIGLYGNVE